MAYTLDSVWSHVLSVLWGKWTLGKVSILGNLEKTLCKGSPDRAMEPPQKSLGLGALWHKEVAKQGWLSSRDTQLTSQQKIFDTQSQTMRQGESPLAVLTNHSGEEIWNVPLGIYLREGWKRPVTTVPANYDFATHPVLLHPTLETCKQLMKRRWWGRAKTLTKHLSPL